jgi:hypothetical protein
MTSAVIRPPAFRITWVSCIHTESAFEWLDILGTQHTGIQSFHSTHLGIANLQPKHLLDWESGVHARDDDQLHVYPSPSAA